MISLVPMSKAVAICCAAVAAVLAVLLKHARSMDWMTGSAGAANITGPVGGPMNITGGSIQYETTPVAHAKAVVAAVAVLGFCMAANKVFSSPFTSNVVNIGSATPAVAVFA
jgi:hypothetical protein